MRPRTTRVLPWPLNLYQTAVGKKWVMALTGIGLLGFVVVHMIGNLHLYEGPRAGRTSTPRRSAISAATSSPAPCCCGSCASGSS